MGRFISADTIIPKPTNPQAFNRYSYCLNNPLKYIDPSGMYFSVTYPWQIPMYMAFTYAYVDPIEAAYQAIMSNSNVPSWVQNYIQTLHSSDRAVNVSFGDIGGQGLGLSAMQINSRLGGPDTTTPDVIMLDYAWLKDTPTLAVGLAHESYHIYESNPGATIQEEFTAYCAGYFVGKTLGWTGASSYEWLFKQEGGLGSDKFLKNVQSVLGGRRSNAASVYRVMPLRQSQMNTIDLLKQGVAAANIG